MLSSDFLMDLARRIQEGVKLTEQELLRRASAPGGEGDAAGFSPNEAISGRSADRDLAGNFAAAIAKLLDEGDVSEAELAEKLGCLAEDVHALRRRSPSLPSRELLSVLALKLALTPEQAKDLFLAAGYEFSKCEVSDIVLLYCLEQGVFDIDEVNAALTCFNLKRLSPQAAVVELDRRAWVTFH